MVWCNLEPKKKKRAPLGHQAHETASPRTLAFAPLGLPRLRQGPALASNQPQGVYGLTAIGFIQLTPWGGRGGGGVHLWWLLPGMGFRTSGLAVGINTWRLVQNWASRLLGRLPVVPVTLNSSECLDRIVAGIGFGMSWAKCRV